MQTWNLSVKGMLKITNYFALPRRIAGLLPSATTALLSISSGACAGFARRAQPLGTTIAAK
jgi:hypothetical protein